MIFNTPILAQFSQAVPNTAPEQDRLDSKILMPAVLNNVIEASEPIRGYGWPADIGGSAVLSGVVTVQQVGAGITNQQIWTNIPPGVYDLDYSFAGSYQGAVTTQTFMGRIYMGFDTILHPLVVLPSVGANWGYHIDGRKRIVTDKVWNLTVGANGVAGVTVTVEACFLLNKHL